MTCTPAHLVYTKIACLIPPKVAQITPNDYTGIVHKTTSTGTLPFTGADLLFLILGGLFLIVLAVSLRRVGKES